MEAIPAAHSGNLKNHQGTTVSLQSTASLATNRSVLFEQLLNIPVAQPQERRASDSQYELPDSDEKREAEPVSAHETTNADTDNEHDEDAAAQPVAPQPQAQVTKAEEELAVAIDNTAQTQSDGPNTESTQPQPIGESANEKTSSNDAPLTASVQDGPSAIESKAALGESPTSEGTEDGEQLLLNQSESRSHASESQQGKGPEPETQVLDAEQDSDTARTSARQKQPHQSDTIATEHSSSQESTPSQSNEQITGEAKKADTDLAASTENLAGEQVSHRLQRNSRREEKWYQKDKSVTNAQGSQSRDPQAAEEPQAGSRPNGSAEAVIPASDQFIDTSPPANTTAAIELAKTEVPSAATSSLPNAAIAAAENASVNSGSTVEDGDVLTSTNPIGGRAKSQHIANSSAQGPGETSDTSNLTGQERVRMVQRIARSFSRLGPDGGQINLKLHPPQLGALNVQVRLEGRSMTAKLSTETHAAREAILEGLPVLRNRLAEQGYDISTFQVDVAENGADSSNNSNPGGEQADKQERQSQQQRSYTPNRLPQRTSERTPLDQVATIGPTENWSPSDGIDIDV